MIGRRSPNDFRDFRAATSSPARIHRNGRGGQLPNGGQELTPVADGRDADLPKVLRRYMTESLLVDPVLPKSGFVLLETETPEPPSHVHGRAPNRHWTIAQRRDSVQRAVHLWFEIDFGRSREQMANFGEASRPQVTTVR